VSKEDYYSGEYLQDVLEADLLELGGQELLDVAHAEAARHVDEHHPWDGRGDEPAERVSAYCAVLWQVAEAARRPPRRVPRSSCWRSRDRRRCGRAVQHGARWTA